MAPQRGAHPARASERVLDGGPLIALQAVRRWSVRRLRRALERRGYELRRDGGVPPIPIDASPADRAVIERVQPYTLTSPERIMALREALRYVSAARIPGAILECGVWRGGSMLAAAMTLVELGDAERDLFMFDTFEAIPPPADEDLHVTGVPVDPAALEHPVFDFIPVDQIRAMLVDAGYPEPRLHFVKGLIEDTIPARAPDAIALCRLDTDWYRSTAHEMTHLYPRISSGGVLIVDDYGEFAGARRAVDEALAADGRPVLLGRADASCRVLITP